ncbi:MAG TPA: nucleotidyl transferase AbiEii/AbiGii toxin family protein [Candidatus Saccharimonadales bacterium]|nr:nucleotidyl transferase AbiEii/AbiGii toxin family protein [Candidatus Saccharimonadales bacterium]
MVAWLPGKDTVLNVAGFADALSSAVIVWFADDLPVPVASLAGLTILKLLAWADRRNINNKDEFDLFQILRHYAVSGNEERLYTDEVATLERLDFDLDLAGARLLGTDAARLATVATAARIRDLLAAEPDVEDLTTRGFTGREENRFIALLLNFRRGFLGEG